MGKISRLRLADDPTSPAATDQGVSNEEIAVLHGTPEHLPDKNTRKKSCGRPKQHKNQG